jgi:hypothetical protein
MSDKESDSEHKGKIRIVDRRRFDSAGEEKTEDVASADATSSNPSKPEISKTEPERKVAPPLQNAAEPEVEESTTGFTMSDSEPNDLDGEEESQISFGSFVLSLATQALMQLGQLPAPDGMAIPVDPAAAQQTIDILAMLQVKSKGNLDAKEEGLLRDALHSLKVAFLRFR